jgi:hypothetical protein
VSVRYETDENGSVYTCKRVARGKEKGTQREGGRKDGCGVLIGHGETYRDPSF